MRGPVDFHQPDCSDRILVVLRDEAKWGDIWIAHCIDQQGAVFALQGKRTKTSQADDPQSAPQVGWSAKWGDISSRGRLLGTKPRRAR